MNMKNDLMKTAGNINNSNQVTYPKPYDERQILIRGKAFQNGRVSMDDIGMMILGGFDLYICILVSIRKMLDKEGKYDEKSETESGSGAS